MTFPFPAFSPYEAAASGITLINRTTSGVAGTNSGSDITFTACPIGTASATRFVIAIVRWEGMTTMRSAASATIGGVAATIVLDFQGSGLTDGRATVVTATVPSGTTADVVITYSSGVTGSSTCYTTAIDNVSSTTALSNPTAAIPAGTAVGTLTMDLRNGGFCLMIALDASTTGYTWSNWTSPLVEYKDGALPSRRGALADGFPTVTDNAASLSVTASGTVRSWVVGGASWR